MLVAPLRLVLLALVALIALLSPTVAVGATSPVTFSEVPAGTALTTQYRPNGMTFSGSSGARSPVVRDVPQGWRVLQADACDTCGAEFIPWFMAAGFLALPTSVDVTFGTSPASGSGAASASIAVEVFDGAGTAFDYATVGVSRDAPVRLRVVAPVASDGRVRAIRVRSFSIDPIWIDDVSFTDPAPTASIESPSPSAVVAGAIKVAATGSDDDAITSGRLWVTNGVGATVWAGTTESGSLSGSWNTTMVPDGTYVVRATFTDVGGQTSPEATRPVRVLNTPPTPTPAPATPTPTPKPVVTPTPKPAVTVTAKPAVTATPKPGTNPNPAPTLAASPAASPAPTISPLRPALLADTCASVGPDTDGDGVSDPCDTVGRPATIAPAVGESAVVKVVSGEVFIKLPGARAGAGRLQRLAARDDGFVPLKGAANVPVGSTVDARSGEIDVTGAVGAAASSKPVTSSARMSAAIFQIRQRRAARRLKGGPKPKPSPTQLLLRTPEATLAAQLCRDRGSRSVVRTMSATAPKGLFAFVGTNASVTAASRNATLRVADRCDGTYVAVGRGTVNVAVRKGGRTVKVRAGRAYLARGEFLAIQGKKGR